MRRKPKPCYGRVLLTGASRDRQPHRPSISSALNSERSRAGTIRVTPTQWTNNFGFHLRDFGQSPGAKRSMISLPSNARNASALPVRTPTQSRETSRLGRAPGNFAFHPATKMVPNATIIPKPRMDDNICSALGRFGAATASHDCYTAHLSCTPSRYH